MNLFLSTRKLTDRREDHLTEFFAAALDVSSSTRQAYYDLAIKRFAETKGWGSCGIENIETQVCYDKAACRPDMRLTLSNGKVIICEHKIEAPETTGPEDDERLQLERYLDLKDVNGVLYVRRRLTSLAPGILGESKYIYPENRAHFLWSDFYSLFEFPDDLVSKWMKEGFEHLRFVPRHPLTGKLDTAEEKRNFAAHWDKTIDMASRLGWGDIQHGGVVELYLYENPSSSADWIWISPSDGKFRIRVIPKAGQRDKCFETLAAACDSSSIPVEHDIRAERKEAYEITATDISVLGREKLPDTESEDRMCEFVSHFLRAINSTLGSK